MERFDYDFGGMITTSDGTYVKYEDMLMVVKKAFMHSALLAQYSPDNWASSEDCERCFKRFIKEQLK